MVSKASEDLPEPDSPVNTTNWSRGMATSTFLRLCSRAPRMVIWRASRMDLLVRSAIELLGPVRQNHPRRTRENAGPPGPARRNVVRTATLCQSEPGIAVENLFENG